MKFQTLFLFLFDFNSNQTLFKMKTEKPKTEKIRGIQGFSTGRGVVALLKTRMDGARYRSPELENQKITRRIHMSRRYASRRYAGGLGPSRIRTRIPTTRQLGQWVSLRKTLRFRVRFATFPVSLPLSSPGDVWPRLPLLASTRP